MDPFRPASVYAVLNSFYADLARPPPNRLGWLCTTRAEKRPGADVTAVRGFKELCDRAAAHGIQAVMEVHFGDGQLYDTSDSTLRILREVDRPNLTVNLQPPLRGETLGRAPSASALT